MHIILNMNFIVHKISIKASAFNSMQFLLNNVLMGRHPSVPRRKEIQDQILYHNQVEFLFLP